MNSLEKRSIYALGVLSYFLSNGKPLNPSSVETMWNSLSEKMSIKYKDKRGNKFICDIQTEDSVSDNFDYANFIEYLDEVNQYISESNLPLFLQILDAGDVTITIKITNQLKITISNTTGEILSLGITFAVENPYSMVVGKKDLYVDGGYAKNVAFIDKIFMQQDNEIPNSIYRMYRDLQQDDYYTAVKFLYDFYSEEIIKKLSDSGYVSWLIKNVINISYSTEDATSTEVHLKDNSKLHIDYDNIASLGFQIVTSNKNTPILKIILEGTNKDVFKIRTKKEKYKDSFRYKSYLEYGSGMKLFKTED